MVTIIRKAKTNENMEIEVKLPYYLYSEDATFKDYMNATPLNKIENDSNSILSLLGGKSEYSDISGMSFLMVAFDGDKVYKNGITVKGRTANYVIVEIDGVDYSVYRNSVVFTKRD